MNVYQKLSEARRQLKAAGLKPSGKNKGVGYTYFDLQDILPQTTKIEKELGLLSVVTFSESEGVLTVYNTEKPEESIQFHSPIREAELRGCHPVQNLGAIETYVRRYLYLLAYEIVETDALDLTQDIEDKPQSKPNKIIADKPVKATQSVGNAVTEEKEKTKSKAKIIQELIKGTDVQPEQITEFIEANFGRPIRVNELTDEQFSRLYKAISKYIKGAEEDE